jgi:hypothetical protein
MRVEYRLTCGDRQLMGLLCDFSRPTLHTVEMLSSSWYSHHDHTCQ